MIEMRTQDTIESARTHLPAGVEQLLICPKCRSRVEVEPTTCRCTGPDCGFAYPIWEGVPVLLDGSRSLFSIAGVWRDVDRPLPTPPSPLRSALSRWTPTLHLDIQGTRNYHTFARQLLRRSKAPRVLVIGSRVLGSGMEALAEYPAISIVESDVELGARPALLFDAHDIPFKNASFDGLIAQAVLEHVVDPQRCVDEIHRVLKPEGLVYAETPFMQQVHEGAYDFTRFTHLGHRRLFRYFNEIESGIACGPGMALAWAWQYFLMSFTRTETTRTLAKLVARLTGWPFKYFDLYLSRRPAAFDAASGFYFMGCRSTHPISDQQLVKLYRGAM